MKMKLCLPAKVYLGLSVLSILLGFIFNVKLAVILWKIAFAALNTWILSILCKKGLKELAWVFVFLPFIVIGSSFIYSPLKEGVTTTTATPLERAEQNLKKCFDQYSENYDEYQLKSVTQKFMFLQDFLVKHKLVPTATPDAINAGCPDVIVYMMNNLPGENLPPDQGGLNLPPDYAVLY